MLCCWFEDPSSEAFQRHLPRLHDYLWVAEDGMKMQVSSVSAQRCTSVVSWHEDAAPESTHMFTAQAASSHCLPWLRLLVGQHRLISPFPPQRGGCAVLGCTVGTHGRARTAASCGTQPSPCQALAATDMPQETGPILKLAHD